MALPYEDKFTFASDDLWLSEFRLLPNDPAWHRPHQTTDQVSLIAIPRTTVAIRHEHRTEVVADPMSAVVYSPAQAYRRRLISAAGDDCTVVAVSADLVAEVVGAVDPSASADTYRFPFSAAATKRSDHLAIERIRRLSTHERSLRAEAIREELYLLVDHIVAAGYRELGTNAAARPSRSWHDLAHGVREELGRDIAHAARLDDVAHRLSVSPFHMVRVFRAVTGRPVHAYLTELRLRSSVPLISDGIRLADVAQQVGFASHAHLTERFVKAYGVTPSRWRELSKNLKAGAHSSP